MAPKSNPPATTFHTRTAGLPAASAAASGKPRIIWAHGWGQSGAAFNSLVESLATQAHHIILDFPGFGASPIPPAAWGTADYADATVKILPPFKGKTLWVGHSFGCRVGIQIAARHPKVLSGLCLIAGAGLPRLRTLRQKLNYKGRVYLFKLLKKIWVAMGKDVAPLRARFGSADYRNAGPLREILVKTVSEDLTEEAKNVTCPTLLIYGGNDTETPPDIGRRLHALIHGSELVILPKQDHYSVLGEGRHQVLKHLAGFLKRVAQ